MNGDTRGTREKAQIYNGATHRWVEAFDIDEDYGGPYKSIKELAAKKRWRDDMIDIYGPKVFMEKYHNVLPEDVKKALRKERSKSRSPPRAFTSKAFSSMKKLPPRTFKSKRGGRRKTRRSSRK